MAPLPERTDGRANERSHEEGGELDPTTARSSRPITPSRRRRKCIHLIKNNRAVRPSVRRSERRVSSKPFTKSLGMRGHDRSGERGGAPPPSRCGPNATRRRMKRRGGEGLTVMICAAERANRFHHYRHLLRGERAEGSSRHKTHPY